MAKYTEDRPLFIEGVIKADAPTVNDEGEPQWDNQDWIKRAKQLRENGQGGD